MMKHEFEAIAGYEVSTEDYNNIIEPMYMATNLSKAEFVKTISKKRFAVTKKEQEQAVFISNGTRTPNGAYVVGRWMIQIGKPSTNIKTGKVTFKVRATTGEEQRKIGWDEWCASSIDINTMNPRYEIREVEA